MEGRPLNHFDPKLKTVLLCLYQTVLHMKMHWILVIHHDNHHHFLPKVLLSLKRGILSISFFCACSFLLMIFFVFHCVDQNEEDKLEQCEKQTERPTNGSYLRVTTVK